MFAVVVSFETICLLSQKTVWVTFIVLTSLWLSTKVYLGRSSPESFVSLNRDCSYGCAASCYRHQQEPTTCALLPWNQLWWCSLLGIHACRCGQLVFRVLQVQLWQVERNLRNLHCMHGIHIFFLWKLEKDRTTKIKKVKQDWH